MLDPAVLALMIPIIAILAAVGFPLTIGLVKVLTDHQRKMAEIVSRSASVNSEVSGELQALKAEIAILRDTVNRHTIEADSINTRLSSGNEEVKQGVQPNV